MPHQCTNCGRTFADGSKEMLSGCPDCGGNKFQFAPTATAAAESSAEAGTGATDSVETSPEESEPSESAGVATRAAETVRDWVSTTSSDGSAPDSAAQSTPAGSASPSPSDAAWPSSGRDGDTGSETGTGGDDDPDGEFAEWPETARRPEDRTGSQTDTTVTQGTSNADGTSDEWPDQPSNGSSRPSDGPTTTLADDENSAQADARSEVVTTDDLPSHADGTARDEPVPGDGAARDEPGQHTDTTGGPDRATDAADIVDAPAGADPDDPPEHGRVVSEPSGQRPSIDELRAELNEQFESIKIVRPGQYELNLMELYDRDEYIISLQEDGRYVIDVPDSWHDGDDDLE